MAGEVAIVGRQIHELRAEQDRTAQLIMEALIEAGKAADRVGRRRIQEQTPEWALELRYKRGTRDGLITAYAILTKQSEESVYEGLQDTLQARYELSEGLR